MLHDAGIEQDLLEKKLTMEGMLSVKEHKIKETGRTENFEKPM